MDEIFMPGGMARLRWNGLKYKIEVSINNDCVGNSTLYDILWAENKSNITNCYEVESEKQILFDKFQKKMNKNDLQKILSESTKIKQERKREILAIISGRNYVDDKKIHTDINDSNQKKIYINTFLNEETKFVDLVNRANVLLFIGNIDGAKKIIDQILKIKKERFVLELNRFYLKNKKYDQIFSFIKDLKMKNKDITQAQRDQSVKKYFQIFLDNYALIGENKYDLKNTSSFLIKALSCDDNSITNMIIFRNCLLKNVSDNDASDLILYMLRQMGDDSLDNLWRI